MRLYCSHGRAGLGREDRAVTNGFQNMATRIGQANRAFADVLAAQGGLTEAEAVAVLAEYLKKGYAKRDAVGGRITVKHGGHLDRACLREVARKLAVCERCGGQKPLGESCGCFDNNCQ